MTSHTILGVRVDDVSVDEVTELFTTWLDGNTQHIVVTPNPEFVLLAQHDAEFRDILNASDLALPDGVGLKLAVPSLHRTTGADGLELLYALCRERGQRIVTLGSAAADVDAGFVDTELSDVVIANIADRRPDVIAVGLGQGKQEKIIARHRSQWPTAKILIGVGGAIDMRAGVQRRAPALLRRIGLEWLWRLITQPRRLRRIVNAVIVFPALLLRSKFL